MMNTRLSQVKLRASEPDQWRTPGAAVDYFVPPVGLEGLSEGTEEIQRDRDPGARRFHVPAMPSELGVGVRLLAQDGGAKKEGAPSRTGNFSMGGSWRVSGAGQGQFSGHGPAVHSPRGSTKAGRESFVAPWRAGVHPPPCPPAKSVCAVCQLPTKSFSSPHQVHEIISHVCALDGLMSVNMASCCALLRSCFHHVYVTKHAVPCSSRVRAVYQSTCGVGQAPGPIGGGNAGSGPSFRPAEPPRASQGPTWRPSGAARDSSAMPYSVAARLSAKDVERIKQFGWNRSVEWQEASSVCVHSVDNPCQPPFPLSLA